ncbi:MAG: type II secretion system protein F [Lachnospiraceae bacterium]|nr:type II secretion system protein F [Lachnospiraceae bacterium]
MDYRRYQAGKKERILFGLEAAALTGVIALCFYNSPWAIGTFPLVLLWLFREKGQTLGERRRKELKLQFKDAVEGIAAALAAGYSAENAVREARRDLQLVYAGSADIVQELSAMERKLDANQTIEAAMEDFAKRSGLEEAETFAEIFAVGKRNGGDLIGIMEDTARTITQIVETERQASMALASRRYEQKVMNLVPFGMILYLRIGCPGFLDPLYGNLAGICVMTGVLGLYLLAWHLGKRLLDIEV